MLKKEQAPARLEHAPDLAQDRRRVRGHAEHERHGNGVEARVTEGEAPTGCFDDIDRACRPHDMLAQPGRHTVNITDRAFSIARVHEVRVRPSRRLHCSERPSLT